MNPLKSFSSLRMISAEMKAAEIRSHLTLAPQQDPDSPWKGLVKNLVVVALTQFAALLGVWLIITSVLAWVIR